MLIFVIVLASACVITLAIVRFIVEKYHEYAILETPCNYDDIDIERETEKQKNKIKKIEELTGNSPIKQIDWVIDNGLNKFYDLCESIMNGTYRDEEEKEIRLSMSAKTMNPEDVSRYLTTKDCHTYVSTSSESIEVYGGLGNKKIVINRPF